MKRILLLTSTIIIFFSSTLFAQENISLDLTRPTNPSEINYTEKGYWDGTYSENHPSLEYGFFSFSHLISGESYGGTYWNGFTPSVSGDTNNYFDEETEGFFTNEQWGCMAGSEITPYLIAYWSDYGDIAGSRVLNVSFEEACVPQYVYIANHPWSYYSVKGYDNQYARALDREGDYFKVIFHAIDENGNETDRKVEYTLAECKTAGEVDASTVWNKVDLTSLGKSSGFFCTMKSTDAGQYGINTPTLFCLQGLNIQKNGNNLDEITSAIQLVSNIINREIKIEALQSTDQISIFNLNGQRIHQTKSFEGTLNIPTSGWQSGIYILKVESAGSTNTYKLIKQ